MEVKAQKIRVKKTEKMSAPERTAFRKWVTDCGTRLDAAEALDVHINTIDRLILTGQGSPETIGKVRVKLNTKQVS